MTRPCEEEGPKKGATARQAIVIYPKSDGRSWHPVTEPARQGRNKTDWPPQQGCGFADRCTLFQRHPKTPDSTSQSQTGRPCPPGRTTAGKLSSGEGGGGPKEFSYLQTTSRFLAFLPPGTNSLGLMHPYLTPSKGVSKTNPGRLCWPRTDGGHHDKTMAR